MNKNDDAVLKAALNDWRDVLGEERVITDADELKRRGSTTYGEVEIPAVLLPHTTEQVSAALKVANQHGVPVYTISTGKNWGYGSGAPKCDGCVVMDLSGLNQIHRFDEKFGTITVGPGVTFGMAEELLEANHSTHFIAAPGTVPEASLIGNIMDRGWGYGPYSDRFDFACGMEVVLADGSIVEMGNARFPGSLSADIFKWGVGPWLDGLFTQSNFGVVTRMTIFLAPLPSFLGSYIWRVDNPEKLPILIDVFRDLRMKQIIRTNFKIQNFHRVLQNYERWPGEVGEAHLHGDLLKEKMDQYGIGFWNGSGALYCWSEDHYKAEREIVDAALRPYVDVLLWIDEEVVANQEKLAPQVKEETGYDLSEVIPHFFTESRIIGIDHGDVLEAYYHKQFTPEHSDIDGDRVGMAWVDPIVPLSAGHATTVLGIVEDVMNKHHFETNLGFNVVTERAMFGTCLLLWDRDREGDDERGLACLQELTERLMDAGYTLGRVANPVMQEVMDRGQPEANKLLATIKDAVDPNGILSPGRYEPTRD